jgi:peptidoglycan-associated lipoprotein
MKKTYALLLGVLCAPAPCLADESLKVDGPQRTELAGGYTYVRPNAPPGQCDCFSMNGASISIAQPVTSPNFALIFDATVVHGSGIGTGRYDLTLSTFTVGIRYRPLPYSRWSPYSQILLGAAHATGSLVEGDTPAAHDASLVFASTIGGGLDFWLNSRWSLRVFEADYLLTTYSNRVNDHQNSLRLSVGAAYHFGSR